jgi:hypothetical protein
VKVNRTVSPFSVTSGLGLVYLSHVIYWFPYFGGERIKGLGVNTITGRLYLRESINKPGGGWWCFGYNMEAYM